MTYAKPDRSKQVRNFTKTTDNDAIDIGHCEGTLSDGRPYAAELWAQDQVTALTIFFSRDGLDLDDESGAELVEREGFARLGPKRGYCAVRPFVDDGGNAM